MEKVGYSLRNYKKQLILGPLFKTIEVIFELFVPLLMKYIIDTGIDNAITLNDYKGVWIPGLMIFLFSAFGFSSTLVCQYMSSICSQGFGTDLRNRIYKHASELSLKEFEKVGKGNLLTLLSNDTQRLQAGIASLIRLAIRAPLLVIGSLIMCAFINLKAFYIFLAIVIVISIIVVVIFISSSKQLLKVQNSVSNIVSDSNDVLNGERVIRAFNKEEEEIDNFKKINEEYYKESKKNVLINALINPITYLFINGAALIIVLLSSKYFDFNIGLSNGDLVSLIQYLNQIMTALFVVFNLVTVFTKAISSKKRVNDFFAIESSLKNGTIKEDTFNKGESLIRFENVSFKYEDDDNEVIKDINFDILKGETVGIIGGTGSGKTTLIKLLERFFDPTSGNVYFNNKNIKEYDITYLNSLISLVSQKVSIFNGTIKENMLIGKNDASEEEIIKALKDADAYSFISQYEDGINHKIVESGKNLSGGQKQRLSIARALIKGGEVLLLDDSTSALDFLTDKTVRNNIKNNYDLTTIIVSQRATSLMDCSKIIVMYHGKIESIGTHEELLKTSKIYKEIYESQIRK